MSETVKLIIEIPKEDIELICKTSFVEDERTMFKQSPSDRQGTMMLFRLMDSVKDGIPLDTVKDKILGYNVRQHVSGSESFLKGYAVGMDKSAEILDNICKGDSE